MPLGVWVFIRLLVPTLPIIIQYALGWAGAIQVIFPDSAFILLLFSISLVTVVEHSDLASVLYWCILPAIIATFLYTTYLAFKNNSAVCEFTCFGGFFFWLLAAISNFLRVVINAFRRQPALGQGG